MSNGVMNSKKIENALLEVFGEKKTYSTDEFFRNIQRIFWIFDMKIDKKIVEQIREKLVENKVNHMPKKQIEKILRVIIEANNDKRVSTSVLDSVFKENTPLEDLETTNTILIEAKDGRNNQTKEFMSILEDVSRGVESLEKKTQSSIDINVGPADSFITQRKSERNRRIEELKAMKRTDHFSSALLSNADANILGKAAQQDNASNVLAKINQIIDKKENESEMYFPVKHLKSCEEQFNQKAISLLKELLEIVNKMPSNQRNIAASSSANTNPPLAQLNSTMNPTHTYTHTYGNDNPSRNSNTNAYMSPSSQIDSAINALNALNQPLGANRGVHRALLSGEEAPNSFSPTTKNSSTLRDYFPRYSRNTYLLLVTTYLLLSILFCIGIEIFFKGNSVPY